MSDEPTPISADLEAERQYVEDLLRNAFRGVTREGGVSWSESEAIHDYCSLDERLIARGWDTDTSWEQLVTDPEWAIRTGRGGFSFLDAVGFRYYIAPVLIRVVRTEEDEHSIMYHLCLQAEADPQPELRSLSLEQWSLLSQPQRRAIALTLRFLSRLEIARNIAMRGEDPKDVTSEWQETLDSYWDQFE